MLHGTFTCAGRAVIIKIGGKDYRIAVRTTARAVGPILAPQLLLILNFSASSLARVGTLLPGMPVRTILELACSIARLEQVVLRHAGSGSWRDMHAAVLRAANSSDRRIYAAAVLQFR